MTQPRNHRSHPRPFTQPPRRRASIGTTLATALAAVALLAVGGHATALEDRPPTPELDLTTLEAETDLGTLHAQRKESSFVAPLGDGQAIGITVEDGTDGEPHEVFVRLYHRQLVGTELGELDAEGRTSITLTRGERSELDATVELTMIEDRASGTVTLMGETTDFTTTPATGVAGVYVAWGTDQSDDTRCQWVVPPTNGNGDACACHQAPASAATSVVGECGHAPDEPHPCATASAQIPAGIR